MLVKAALQLVNWLKHSWFFLVMGALLGVALYLASYYITHNSADKSTQVKVIAVAMLATALAFNAIVSFIQYNMIIGSKYAETVLTPWRRRAGHTTNVIVLVIAGWGIAESKFFLTPMHGRLDCIFPELKNCLVVGLACVFLIADWILMKALPKGAIKADIAILVSLLVSSVFLASLRSINNEELILAVNTGMLVFHTILATLLFEPIAEIVANEPCKKADCPLLGKV